MGPITRDSDFSAEPTTKPLPQESASASIDPLAPDASCSFSTADKDNSSAVKAGLEGAASKQSKQGGPPVYSADAHSDGANTSIVAARSQQV